MCLSSFRIGHGPRKPASPSDEPNFYSMSSIPLDAKGSPPAPSIRTMLPKLVHIGARKPQDGYGGGAESNHGPIPLTRLCSLNLSERHQEQSWQTSMSSACSLYSTMNGRSTAGIGASVMEETYPREFAFAFPDVSSLGSLGCSIAANQESAQQGELSFTATSRNVLQDASKAGGHPEASHVGGRGIFAFEDDSDDEGDDQYGRCKWSFSDLDFEPIKLFD